MYNVTLKELIPNIAYLFELPQNNVTDDLLKDYVSRIQCYIQQRFPNRGYNLYEEVNRDMLCVVAIMDVNDLPPTEVVAI